MFFRRLSYFILITLFAATIVYIVQRSDSVQRIWQAFFPTPVKKVVAIKGIGVIGDSQSDEYQADDARGYTYAPRTLNWIEQLVKTRHLNFGTWQTWGDVRRTGFAYNWSRTGATTDSIVVNEQPEGLASSVASGEVNVAIIYIGANDFAPYNFNEGYLAIYNGELSGDALAQKIDRVVANIETAITTIQEAGNVQIFLVTIPDWNASVHVQVGFYDQEKRARVSDVVSAVNKRIVSFAKKRGVPVIDVNAFYQDILRRAPLGSFSVGLEQITLLIPSDDPHHAFLSDAVHPGTILSGLFANLVIQRLNQELGTSISPLQANEILGNAGL